MKIIPQNCLKPSAVWVLIVHKHQNNHIIHSVYYILYSNEYEMMKCTVKNICCMKNVGAIYIIHEIKLF